MNHIGPRVGNYANIPKLGRAGVLCPSWGKLNMPEVLITKDLYKNTFRSIQLGLIGIIIPRGGGQRVLPKLESQRSMT